MLELIKNIFGNKSGRILKGMENRDSKYLLKGTLNAYTEFGWEGHWITTIGLADDQVAKNPDKQARYDGQVYDLRAADQFAIFDLSGRLIFDRGKYIVNETWEHPGIGRCDDLPKNIKESDWAHWCENHFSITVYLK